ncbi:hypothetical protein N7478_004025 [Penicillium angulare]|uniref:uncharacterized protein n=1 Tax=Penicillium angulare TaxID=116970 RepID=UPI0025407B3F|nr:uncharacterized protein N7478_004025 [Penicillium angulare]KAJ5278653.1 hypothetical protein N7478_004025 [Penicillium angulare]
MRFNSLAVAWLGLTVTSSAIGLHKAVDGLIQVTPSFSGDGVVMHPGLEPNHDPYDLEHLIPNLDKVLYYSQEGHRPALHGSKHASLEAKFVRHTVVLDQSDHIKSVTCDDNNIQVCFKSPHALKAAGNSWGPLDSFNLATYHAGCGDESSGKRSYFHASSLSVNSDSMCVVMDATRVGESDALDSGVVSWGTYVDPNNRRRTPVKGHVRVNRPSEYDEKPRNGTMPRVMGTGSMNRTMDVAYDPWALEYFFNNSHMDTSNMGAKIDTMNFEQMDDPGIPKPPKNMTKRLSTNSRHERAHRSMNEVSKRNATHLARRGILADVWDGLRDLGRRIENFFKSSFSFILQVGDFLIQVAIISAKLLLVPFGVPFDHSYHNDIYVHEYLNSYGLDKPPAIFGLKNGYTLLSHKDDDGKWIVQCAKCGIHVNMNIDGRLAFSIKNGITEGTIQLTNVDPLKLDAQFGLTAESSVSKTRTKHLKRKGKEIKNIPLSPLTIPGIITLGPQVSVGVALGVEAAGKVELLVGGTISLSKGYARASVTQGKNGVEGLEPSFDPIFRAAGEFTLTGDLGIPMALEVGLDVLEGKFKKTVGLVNTPSVYVKATASLDTKGESSGKSCPNGVSLSVGARNRVHVAGFDIWEEELLSIPLFEKSVGCVTANGFNRANEKEDKALISQVNTKLGGDPNSGKPTISDATREFKKVEGAQGFRILMDAKGDTILVAGRNGALYLVGKDSGYDVSAPWGTLDTNENPLTLDVFGRTISYKFLQSYEKRSYYSQERPMLADLVVSDPKKVRFGYRAT